MKTTFFAFAILCIFAASISDGHAQSALDVAIACKPDYDRHCPGVKPGGGRIIACLTQHKSELLPACSNALASIRAQRRAIAACMLDYDRHCGAVVPGGGRILACLADHKKDLTPGCTDTLSEVQANLRSFLSVPFTDDRTDRKGR